jgi:hypothetical protein
VSGPTTQNCSGEHTAEAFRHGFCPQLIRSMIEGIGMPGMHGPHALGRQSRSDVQRVSSETGGAGGGGGRRRGAGGAEASPSAEGDGRAAIGGGSGVGIAGCASRKEGDALR